MKTNQYDVVIIGAGAGGLFAAYELMLRSPDLKIALLEKGVALDKRKCPITTKNTRGCIDCNSCSITEGIGGAGAFSDGKYNITTAFGGDIAKYVGEDKAIELMQYVDSINMSFGGKGAVLYDHASASLKHEALKYDLHISDASIRHLGTDRNLVILGNLVNAISHHVDIFTSTEAQDIISLEDKWLTRAEYRNSAISFESKYLVIATGRSGSEWTSNIAKKFDIPIVDDRVDIGVRFECPAEIWAGITDKVYESKILYRSHRTGCTCRTFCMNPYGYVVTENTRGIVTVNGHSYDDVALRSGNTNFALLVSHHFTEPFHDSNAYGQAVAKMTNMLAGGVMVQRFGDLVENRRTKRTNIAYDSFVHPTLDAEPGNLGLAIPKMTLDTIIEMIYALDKLVPGTANYDNLLYGSEVKFYNSIVEVNSEFETKCRGLYMIGDGSGTTHSLSQAASEGVATARSIASKEDKK